VRIPERRLELIGFSGTLADFSSGVSAAKHIISATPDVDVTRGKPRKNLHVCQQPSTVGIFRAASMRPPLSWFSTGPAGIASDFGVSAALCE
jgi:hypothetical protein